MTFNFIARWNKPESAEKKREYFSELKIKVSFGRAMVIANPHLNAQNKYLTEQTSEV